MSAIEECCWTCLGCGRVQCGDNVSLGESDICADCFDTQDEAIA